ncbi:MAG: hypothetical protein WDM79_14325 [Terricaulis sp.]
MGPGALLVPGVAGDAVWAGGEQDAREARAFQLRGFASVDHDIDADRFAHELIAEHIERGFAGIGREAQRLRALFGRGVRDFAVGLQVSVNHHAAHDERDDRDDAHDAGAEQAAQHAEHEKADNDGAAIEEEIAWHDATLAAAIRRRYLHQSFRTREA